MSEIEPPEASDVRPDGFLGGRLQLLQLRRGHRAGTDAVLLASAGSLEGDERFLDIGAGVGAAGLSLALQSAAATGVLLERDSGLAALARANVQINGLAARMSVVEVDLFDGAAKRDNGLGGLFDIVVTNPPFESPGSGRPPLDTLKAAAYVAQSQTQGDPHGAWIRASLRHLGAHGRFVIIHKPERISSILEACASALGGIRLRFVHAHENTAAIRVLVGGRRGSKAPLTVLPPLVLHKAEQGFSAEAESLHQGATMQFWH